MALARPLPVNVAERARIHLLDTIAAMVSGSQLPAGVAARKYISQWKGEPIAHVVASGARTTPVEAALANAMAAHADETDDAHPASITHPGCAVVPAALAVAELTGASGENFLRAVALGYDFCGRFGIAMGGGPFITERGFDSHAFGGSFAAAAAAGALSVETPRDMASVLSYAAQQTSGLATLFRDREHIEKAFVFAGMPARNGVAAAMMVRAGLPGVGDVFDGVPSFFSAFGVRDAGLFDDLGASYAIADTNIKRWTVGSPMQAALDSLEHLIRTHSLRADDVEEAIIHLPTEGAQVVDGRKMPSVNAQHLTALMLVDGTVGFHSSHDEERMRDPVIVAMRERVRLVPSDELMRAQPARQAIAELRLRNGSLVSHRTHAVRGTTKNPMTHEEVAAKATELMVPVVGAGRAQRIIESVWNISKAENLHALAGLIGEN